MRYTRKPSQTSMTSGILLPIPQRGTAAADRVITEIFDALRALAQFPHQGHRRPDLTSRPLRFKLVRDFLIAYAPDESPLWVIAVLHGRRSPRVMAAILRDRESR